MRILLVTLYWHPEQGVVQRRWEWLSKILVEQGHHLTVIAPPPHYPGGLLLSSEPQHQAGAVDDSHPRIKVYRCSFRTHDKTVMTRIYDQLVIMLSSFRCARRAYCDTRKNSSSFDIVCCTVPAIPSAITAYVIAKILHLPFVVELRDAWPELLNNMDEWKDRYISVTWLRSAKLRCTSIILKTGGRVLDHILKHSDGIITTTKSLGELETRKGYKHIATVPNLIRTALPVCERQTYSSSAPLRLLYAGTIGRAQGLENVIRALKILHNRNIPFDMRFIGGGAHINTVRKNAARLGIPVSFLGRIPFTEMKEHYLWSDTVLVHLQKWKVMEYTVPSKLFEIMQIGRHVTACVAGEAATIVNESQAGHVVPPMDPLALANMWEDLYYHREKLDVSGNAQRWFEQHRSSACLAQTWVNAITKVAKI